METAGVNLAFLQSLGKDWEIFGLAKGNTLRTMPTAEIHAEVWALDTLRNPPACLQDNLQ